MYLLVQVSEFWDFVYGHCKAFIFFVESRLYVDELIDNFLASRFFCSRKVIP